MAATTSREPSTNSPEPTETQRVFEFPDRTEHLGTPPLVGYLESDGPFLMREAVGCLTFPDGEPLALEFRSHVPHQLRDFLQMTEHSRIPPGGYPPELRPYQRVYIREGAVGIEDLEMMGFAELTDLVLGWERGTDGHGEHPLTFFEGPDLFEVTGLYSLEVHAVEFTDRHLSTLGSAQRLRYLALDGVEARPASVARCRELQVLLLADLGSFGTDLSFVGSLPNLVSFGMRFSPLEAHHLAHVALHPAINVLDIAYNPGIGAELSILAGATGLIYLNLSGSRVDGTTLKTLSGLGGLERLELQCTNVTDDGLDALSAYSRVTTLNVAGNRITDEGLVRIVDAMPQLRKLDIRSTDVTPDGAMALGRLKDLRSLGLSGDLLTIRLVEHLKAETRLVWLESGPPHPDFDEEIEAIDIVGGCRHVGAPV